ncbi:hypothetical protein CHS0354_002757 [Potamilus streckersoni]|uniref:Uncharacterized protein n=1 Tax=Potamilus streckersoni TaxID=2493646 RepID=A0AAE0W6E8_9BIVA|nr:hypothetical protein CHS0354_002757 [Potamilus streckersoni]
MRRCNPTHIWKHSRGECNRNHTDIDPSSQLQESKEHATITTMPNYDHSVPISVSSKREISVSNIYQYSREIAVQGTTRRYKSKSRISGQCFTNNVNPEKFELFNIATVVQAGFCKRESNNLNESAYLCGNCLVSLTIIGIILKTEIVALKNNSTDIWTCHWSCQDYRV